MESEEFANRFPRGAKLHAQTLVLRFTNAPPHAAIEPFKESVLPVFEFNDMSVKGH